MKVPSRKALLDVARKLGKRSSIHVHEQLLMSERVGIVNRVSGQIIYAMPDQTPQQYVPIYRCRVCGELGTANHLIYADDEFHTSACELARAVWDEVDPLCKCGHSSIEHDDANVAMIGRRCSGMLCECNSYDANAA